MNISLAFTRSKTISNSCLIPSGQAESLPTDSGAVDQYVVTRSRAGRCQHWPATAHMADEKLPNSSCRDGHRTTIEASASPAASPSANGGRPCHHFKLQSEVTQHDTCVELLLHPSVTCGCGFKRACWGGREDQGYTAFLSHTPGSSASPGPRLVAAKTTGLLLHCTRGGRKAPESQVSSWTTRRCLEVTSFAWW